MTSFQLAHGAGGSASELIDSCLQQLGEISADSNVAFVYISDYLMADADKILDTLRKRTPVRHWLGTVGIGIIAGDREYYDQPALAIMLASFDEQEIRSIPNLKENTAALNQELIDWCNQHDYNVALLHADPDSDILLPLLDEIYQTIPGAFLLGGISSSRASHVQYADGYHTGGISGMLFSPHINIISNLSQGCSPVGPRRRITQCEKNVLFTIDDRPALEVMKEDAGEMIARDIEQAANYIFAGLISPGSDTEDYTIRQLVGADPDTNRLAIADFPQQGQDMIFCHRDGNTAREDLLRMLQQIKSRIKGSIRGGIYVSCVGRGRNQFGDNSEEVQLIRDILGDFPLTGFFANGEIHKSQFYGFTGVLTLFLDT